MPNRVKKVKIRQGHRSYMSKVVGNVYKIVQEFDPSDKAKLPDHLKGEIGHTEALGSGNSGRHQGRLIFYSGSQNSYITERARNKLKLPPGKKGVPAHQNVWRRSWR